LINTCGDFAQTLASCFESAKTRMSITPSLVQADLIAIAARDVAGQEALVGLRQQSLHGAKTGKE
jgi:hypothetical protein